MVTAAAAALPAECRACGGREFWWGRPPVCKTPGCNTAAWPDLVRFEDDMTEVDYGAADKAGAALPAGGEADMFGGGNAADNAAGATEAVGGAAGTAGGAPEDSQQPQGLAPPAAAEAPGRPLGPPPGQEASVDLFGEVAGPTFRNLLCQRFGVPPFSVLNAREGDWQERKRRWVSMGIQSEVGRADNLLGYSSTLMETDPAKRAAKRRGAMDDIGSWARKNAGMGKEGDAFDKAEAAMVVDGYDGGNAFSGSGTSIFDPVLCELSYRWYSPPGGSVLDPFAGGSVRGIVAAALGRAYFGCELRKEQVEANRAQAEKLLGEVHEDFQPVWFNEDSRAYIPQLKGAYEFDMIYSCPPYGDLEVYSDDPKDISTLTQAQFLEAYRDIIKAAVALLKPDRFAAFVVGDYRDKDGYLQNFVGETVAAFAAAGARYLNEFIFVQPVGTWALRVTKIFNTSRKCGRVDQRMLVFCKGDPKRAAAACGAIEGMA